MEFEAEKEAALRKMRSGDKSTKGSVDAQARPLLDKLNSLPDYFTTSSCAGRIQLFNPSPDRRKREHGWLWQTHEPALAEEVRARLAELPPGLVFLRMEPPILHVRCRDWAAARALLDSAAASGFPRAALISAERFLAELCFFDRLDAPVASDGKVLVDQGYLRLLVDEANARLAAARGKMERLRQAL